MEREERAHTAFAHGGGGDDKNAERWADRNFSLLLKHYHLFFFFCDGATLLTCKLSLRTARFLEDVFLL